MILGACSSPRLVAVFSRGDTSPGREAPKCVPHLLFGRAGFFWHRGGAGVLAVIAPDASVHQSATVSTGVQLVGMLWVSFGAAALAVMEPLFWSRVMDSDQEET